MTFGSNKSYALLKGMEKFTHKKKKLPKLKFKGTGKVNLITLPSYGGKNS